MDNFEDIVKLGPSIETDNNGPIKTVKLLLSNSVNATVGTVVKYVSDILDSGTKSIKNFSSLASISKYKEHGFKNIPKSLISGSSEAITMVKNATIGGAVGGVGHFYKHGIQNNVKTLTNGTTEWIPGIGGGVSDTINICFTLPAVIPHILNALSAGIHLPLNKLNNMSSDGKRSKVRLRI